MIQQARGVGLQPSRRETPDANEAAQVSNSSEAGRRTQGRVAAAKRFLGSRRLTVGPGLKVNQRTADHWPPPRREPWAFIAFEPVGDRGGGQEQTERRARCMKTNYQN